MSNQNMTKKKFITLASGRAFRKGWVDVMAGKGYDPSYETMTTNEAYNYENGRVYAMNVRVAFKNITVKFNHFVKSNRKDGLVQIPKAIVETIVYANHIAGNPMF